MHEEKQWAIQDRVVVFGLTENAMGKRNRSENFLLIFKNGELAYNCSRKEYKQFIEAKKHDFRSNSLLSTVNDSQAFWKEIRNAPW